MFFDGFKGLKHIEKHRKLHATLSKVHTTLDNTCDTYQGVYDTFTKLATVRVRYVGV
jgi:hypothetical protein